MSTLKDVINTQRRQMNRLSELKNTILSKSIDKINNLSKHGQLKCVYNIPKYFFGYPAYNPEDVTDFILNGLTKEGLCVIKLNDTKLFISWDITDINSMNKLTKKPQVKSDISDLLPIINIKK